MKPDHESKQKCSDKLRREVRKIVNEIASLAQTTATAGQHPNADPYAMSIVCQTIADRVIDIDNLLEGA